MPKKSNKKRADGRIAVQVYIGTIDGKRKYKTVYGKTQKEANLKADELKVELSKGITCLSGENKTFSFWASAWLKKLEKTATPEWLRTCTVRTEPWVDALGSADITKITTFELDNVINDIRNCNPYTQKPSSRKTLVEYRNVIHRIFEFCIQNRVVDFNPANYITLPQAQQKQIRQPLTDEQINYFWETPHVLQVAALIMIYTGPRRGEVCALNWTDFNLNKNTVTIDKAVNFKNNGVIKSPKTDAGYRTNPIPKLLADFLRTLPRTSLQVVNNNGVPFTNSTWNSAWNNYISIIREKYNVPDFNTSAHCLRHTYCTLLYEAGVDVLTAKELMGHADITTTMGIYTHLRQEREQKSIIKLDNYLSANKNASQMQVSQN